MGEFKQENRRISVKTPLGEDVLLLTAFEGREVISGLFNFQLELTAFYKTPIPFESLLGEGITIRLALPDGSSRFINGICVGMTQGERGGDDDKDFTAYEMTVVPKLWRLSQKAQSRIFQQLNVPDILRKVLGEHGVSFKPEIQGTFHPRNYCVQYRETDLNFVSRIMEEEGIYYFFKHSDGGHEMVLANSPGSHPTVPGPTSVIFEESLGGLRDEDRILKWRKTQALRPGRYTLWDHTFELSHKQHLEAKTVTLSGVAVGKVTHKLGVGQNESLEIFDFPGEYAQRFDGIDKSGGPRPADLQKIFEDKDRTVALRMQQEERPALEIKGSSNVRHLVAGHKFTLTSHFNGDGDYVIVDLSHSCQAGADYRSASGGEFQYENSFTCLPFALPFVPSRITPKPVIPGAQTAIVVGPAGEEIFTDKYGRVKVQFHWDRVGKYNPDSSCWIRVATTWAGGNWGAVHLPRVGQEVVVSFEEGDPDQPIITGSVYNSELFPPYALPAGKTLSGVKSRSTLGGGTGTFNEIRFEDKKGAEEVYVHGERDLKIAVENDASRSVGNDDDSLVRGNQYETVEGNVETLVGGEVSFTVEADYMGSIGGDFSCEFKGDRTEKVSRVFAVEAGKEIYLKSGMKLVIEAGSRLSLKGPGGFIDIGPAGITIQGNLVKINSGGSAASGSEPVLQRPRRPQKPKQKREKNDPYDSKR